MTLFVVIGLVGDSLLGGSSTVPGLDSNDLQVQRAKVHAVALPSSKVVGDRDGPAGSGTVADGNVLVEGLGA